MIAFNEKPWKTGGREGSDRSNEQFVNKNDGFVDFLD